MFFFYKKEHQEAEILRLRLPVRSSADPDELNS